MSTPRSQARIRGTTPPAGGPLDASAGGAAPGPTAHARGDLDRRLDELEQRMQEVDRRSRLRARGRTVMDKVLPGEARRHFRTATREQLLGVRSVVDFWIRELDEREEAGRGTAREPLRETIDIDEVDTA